MTKQQLEMLYRIILRRDIDDSGLKSFFNSSITIDNVIDTLYSSSEFQRLKIKKNDYYLNLVKNHKNVFFDKLPIYYVNLDRDTVRRKTLEDSFKAFGISNYTRISAFDVKNIKDDSSVKYHKNMNKFSNKGVGLGHYACLLSFIKAFNKFLESDNEYAFICEDDLDFSFSSKITFNFFDSLKYHNPKLYHLKTSAANLQYLLPKDKRFTSFSVGKLIKPDYLTFGWSSIVNKTWVTAFLKRYGALHISNYDKLKLNLKTHESNFKNTLPKPHVPAIDAITWDDDTYLFISFAPSSQHYQSQIQEYKKAWHLASYYYRDILNYTSTIDIDSFIEKSQYKYENE